MSAASGGMKTTLKIDGSNGKTCIVGAPMPASFSEERRQDKSLSVFYHKAPQRAGQIESHLLKAIYWKPLQLKPRK